MSSSVGSVSPTTRWDYRNDRKGTEVRLVVNRSFSQPTELEDDHGSLSRASRSVGIEVRVYLAKTLP